VEYTACWLVTNLQNTRTFNMNAMPSAVAPIVFWMDAMKSTINETLAQIGSVQLTYNNTRMT
jgi:hypothetical protein